MVPARGSAHSRPNLFPLNLNGTQVVVLREPVSYTKLPSLYAAADCIVLPTHGEGWGLPLAEAMAMAKPVSRGPNPPDAVY